VGVLASGLLFDEDYIASYPSIPDHSEIWSRISRHLQTPNVDCCCCCCCCHRPRSYGRTEGALDGKWDKDLYACLRVLGCRRRNGLNSWLLAVNAGGASLSPKKCLARKRIAMRDACFVSPHAPQRAPTCRTSTEAVCSTNRLTGAHEHVLTGPTGGFALGTLLRDLAHAPAEEEELGLEHEAAPEVPRVPPPLSREDGPWCRRRRQWERRWGGREPVQPASTRVPVHLLVPRPGTGAGEGAGLACWCSLVLLVNWVLRLIDPPDDPARFVGRYTEEMGAKSTRGIPSGAAVPRTLCWEFLWNSCFTWPDPALHFIRECICLVKGWHNAVALLPHSTGSSYHRSVLLQHAKPRARTGEWGSQHLPALGDRLGKLVDSLTAKARVAAKAKSAVRVPCAHSSRHTLDSARRFSLLEHFGQKCKSTEPWAATKIFDFFFLFCVYSSTVQYSTVQYSTVQLFLTAV